jgi:hypothetical protein
MFFAFDNIVTSRGGFIIRVRREEVVWIGLNGWVGRFVGLGRSVGIGRSDRDSLVFSLSSFRFLASALSKLSADSTHELHSDQEVVLVLDQELEYFPRQAMFLGMHSMIRMRQDSRLEDKCEI